MACFCRRRSGSLPFAPVCQALPFLSCGRLAMSRGPLRVPPPALHTVPHVPGAPRWLLSGTSRPSFRPLLTSLPGAVLRAMGSGRRRRLLPLTAGPLSPVFLTERLKSRGSRSKGALTRIYRFIMWAGASLVAQTVESACSAGDVGSIPGLGRSPGKGNRNPLQYPCLENPMDRGVWQGTVHGVTKRRTRLSDFHYMKRDTDEQPDEDAQAPECRGVCPHGVGVHHPPDP